VGGYKVLWQKRPERGVAVVGVVARSVVLGVVSLALAGASGEAAGADPVPRPPRQPAAHHAQVKRPHHVRPRTVVRCQSDGDDQVEEFDDQDDLPQYTFSPGAVPAARSGECSGRALDIARVLAGDRRPVRRPRAAVR
jgi:hypothetical protein